MPQDLNDIFAAPKKPNPIINILMLQMMYEFSILKHYHSV